VIGPIRIGLQTLYTPVFALTLLVLARTWLVLRPAVRFVLPAPDAKRLLWLGAVAIGVCLIVVLPQLAGIARAYLQDRLPGTEVYWRSSPRGLDVLAYLVPNPNHPWFGDATHAWFMPPRPDAYPEFVGSLSIVALVMVVLAGTHALPRFWIALTAFFALLSLGPFVHIGGINTYVPGPWAILRFVPVIGMARSPTRFAVIAALGLAVLLGFSLQALLRNGRRERRLLVGVAAALLSFELLPVPRPLFSAAVPEAYAQPQVTSDETGALMDLPIGIRDGTSSLGDFTTASQYYQTLHRRPLVGGYLSRISNWQKEETLRSPMLRALFELSEKQMPTRELLEEARASRDSFLQRACVRLVMLDRHRASDALREFAVSALGLTPIFQDASYQLFTPNPPPVCVP
jgi:hypothetical protein